MYGGIIAVGYTIFTTSLIGNKIDEDNKKQDQINQQFDASFKIQKERIQELETKLREHKETSDAYMATSIVGMGLAFGMGIMSAWKRV